MLTFQDQYEMAQEISGDYSAAKLVTFKRDINEGATVFLNQLGRKFNSESKTANLVADQQYYTFPQDFIRVNSVVCPISSNRYTPQLVTSEDEWNRLNMVETTGNIPMYYYIRGFNEIGLYPIPSTSVTGGLVVSYQPQHVALSQDDYSTGTVTVTNGSVTLTHSGTGFTPQMVGRWLQVLDGTDGKWYRIASYTSTSVLSLENYYEGISGSGRTFRIGEVTKIPQGYQDAPVFWALDKFYLGESDKVSAATFQGRFTQQLKLAKSTYGQTTAQMGTRIRRHGRRAQWIDLTPPVTYP